MVRGQLVYAQNVGAVIGRPPTNPTDTGAQWAPLQEGRICSSAGTPNVGAVIGRPQNPVFLPRHNRGENKISALCQGKATGNKKEDLPK